MRLKNITAFLSGLALMAGLSGCDGEKDLFIYEEDLPIKTSALYLVGDATPNGWSIDRPTAMTAGDEDPLVFTWQGPLTRGEMKLCLTTGSWDVAFIRPVNNGDEIGRNGVAAATFRMYAGEPDNKWKIVDAGIYDLTFNLREWTMSAAYVREPDAPVIEPIEAEALYIVGDATPEGWNIDAPTMLDKTGDYTFVFEGPLVQGELKACLETGSWDVAFIRPSDNGCAINADGVADDSFVYTMNPDDKWKVEQPGIYRLTFDLEHWTVAAEYTGDFKPASRLYMIGEATDGGWSWDAATEIEAAADNDDLFVWEGELGCGSLKAARVKDFGAPFYRPASNGCAISSTGVESHEMVFTESPDDQWMVTEAGRYRLTFNTAAMTFDAEYLGEEVSIPDLYMIGSATAGGWSLDDATLYTPTGNDGEYTWTGYLSEGTFKACTVRDFSAPFYRPSSGNVEISAAGITASDVVYTTDPDDQWNVRTAGTYTVTINIKAMTIKVQYQ